MRINSFSFHKPTIYNFSQINLKNKYHSYNKNLLKSYKYISDSSMKFNFKLLNNLIHKGDKIHLLIHPLWWCTKSNNINKKIHEVINIKQKYLNSIFKDYLNLLKTINIKKSKKNFLYHLKLMK